MAVGSVNGNQGNPYAPLINEKKAGVRRQASSPKTEADKGVISELGDESLYTKGRTIGKPTLSKAGEAFYEKLQKKYGDMDFILVSKDQKENAKAHAASFANKDHTVVLIDEDKVEAMAADETYAKKIEGQIDAARNKLPDLKQAFAAAGVSVKGFGIQINDNGAASFLASVDKNLQSSSKAQAERIAKKRAEKKAEEKKIDKKALKEAREEKLKEARAEDRKAEKVQEENLSQPSKDDITFSSDTIEGLVKQVSDYQFSQLSDTVQTQQEKALGTKVDFSG